MGGVGKSTALQALWYDELVKRAYKDRIGFLKFGQDADDRRVNKEVARFVRVFGRKNEAQGMN